jgi:hypothetical protein
MPGTPWSPVINLKRVKVTCFPRKTTPPHPPSGVGPPDEGWDHLVPLHLQTQPENRKISPD